jgi:hypothetical protein
MFFGDVFGLAAQTRTRLGAIILPYNVAPLAAQRMNTAGENLNMQQSSEHPQLRRWLGQCGIDMDPCKFCYLIYNGSMSAQSRRQRSIPGCSH